LPDEVLVTFHVPTAPNESPEAGNREYLYDDAGVRQLLIDSGAVSSR
jgi:hypothetical protein